ncbi:MAG: DUF2975 domain-containing protein [Bacilli bacterium]|nr:DUF2975 domain-containing protein [Bacilli bacterium]
MQKNNLSRFISILLRIILIIGIILIPFIPTIFNLIGTENLKEFSNQTIFYKIALFTCYFISLGILYILILMFNHIYKDNPFTIYTEKYLKLLSFLFMILSFIIFIKLFFIPTIISIAICVITFIVSLCFYTLSEIFKVANSNKKELDLTV